MGKKLGQKTWESLISIYRKLFKKKRSRQFLKEPVSTIQYMELMEQYKTELFQSISIIPDEILPFLGDRVYNK